MTQNFSLDKPIHFRFNKTVMDTQDHPRFANTSHFSTEEFPQVIGFCDRDNATHVLHTNEEVYEYKLHGKIVYVVKKQHGRWQITEFEDAKITRSSTDVTLGNVLLRALAFVETDRTKQQSRTNILIPVAAADKERAVAIMYHLGGYPQSFLPWTAELLFIKNTFLDPQLDFLAYPYVPVEYIPWLREQLREASITGQEQKRTVWIYQK
jgi:hypothetical protein